MRLKGRNESKERLSLMVRQLLISKMVWVRESYRLSGIGSSFLCSGRSCDADCQ